MVIIPLLVIELKATPNGNPRDDFFGGRNLALSMLCNIIPPVGLLFYHLQIYIAYPENLINWATLEYIPGLTHILLSITYNQIFFFFNFFFKSNSEHCPGPEFRLIPKLISWAGSKPNMQNFLKYVLTITTGYSIIMEYCPGNRRKSKTEKGKI